MKEQSRFWLRATSCVAGALAMFLAGVYTARAGDGSPGPALSYAGVLLKDDAPLTAQQELTFTFKKAGQQICVSPSLEVTPDSEGRFQVQIPMAGCPSSLLDGTAVTVDIAVGSAVASKDVALTPVPYAVHADQLGTATCPSGYETDKTASAIANVIGCVRGNDHVVRVGTGATAFWIDRYEGSVWSDFGAQGQQWGDANGYPSSFPPTGQGSLENQLYAVSKPGVIPSTQLTWFQANRACRASGKRLATGEEWMTAATGTPHGTQDGSGPCSTLPGAAVRPTGQGGACASVWGAEDMVGNQAELTAEWAIGVGNQSGVTPIYSWPSNFGGNTWNVTSTAYEGAVGPMEVVHGGTVYDGAASTVFALATTQTVAQPTAGFRCVIPR